jgi:alkanesulfonate monooxygenase SsuD/methylene tetrahydromethanopterin reductase-like flavin-dependent oxidoreductase (luciferase family)
MPRLSFGLALDFGTRRASLDRVLDEYVPLLRLAERYGFSSVWAGENYPSRPGGFHLPSPLLVLGSLSRSTTLRLGTGVTLGPAWQPLRLAYDVAVLDQLSGGRCILGIGAGDPRTWRRFGADRERIGDFMDELVPALKALWSGADGFRGQTVQIEGGIAPLPVQRGGPPVWVGGAGTRAARRAAAQGDGWYAATSYALSRIRLQVERYRRTLDTIGGPPRPGRVSVNRLAHLADSPGKVVSEGGPYLERVLEQYAAMGGLPSTEAAREAVAPAFPPVDGTTPLLGSLGASLCLLGSPETVAQQLDAYAAAGVTDIQLRVAPADMPSELIARTITLVGEQVLPRFR